MTVSTKEKIRQTTPPASAAVNRRWWRLALDFTLYAIIAIAVLESFFRIAGVGQQEFLQPDLRLGCRHIPNKVVTWRLEGYSCDRLNTDGLRDSEHTFTKPPGVFRIALLGDSATESLQVNMDETYGKVLESMLNKRCAASPMVIDGKSVTRFEVVNFGCSSYSTGQELIEYKNHVQKYHPDCIALLFNRGDSIENCLNLKAKDSPEPRPYFYLDQSGAPQTDNTVLAANADKLAPNPTLDFLRAQSRIYGVFSQANLSLSLTDSRYRKFRGWLDRTTAFFKGTPPQRMSAVSYPQQDELKVTTALIKTLAHEVKANGQSFILILFPNIGHDHYFNSQTDRLKELARANQFSYLDLTPTFVASPNPADNFLWYHFSPTGHRLVAQQLFTPLKMLFP